MSSAISPSSAPSLSIDKAPTPENGKPTSVTSSPLKAEKKSKDKSLTNKAFADRVQDNADSLISGAVTAGGAAAAIASGNPTGFYPVYSRLLAWETPNIISGADKSVTGLDNGKRAFNVATALGHIGFVGSFLISPFIDKYMRENVFPGEDQNKALRLVTILNGLGMGVATACAGLLVEKSFDRYKNKNYKPAFQSAVKAEITKEYNQKFKDFLAENKKTGQSPERAAAFCKEILDEKAMERIILNAFEKVRHTQSVTEPGKKTSKEDKDSPDTQGTKKKKTEKKPLGLPRINLQNLITLGLSGGLLAFGETGEGIDGRHTGNTLLQMGSAQRIAIFGLYKMLYHPIFIEKDRSFTKDFSTLNSGQIKSDFVTAGNLGASKVAVDYARNNQMISTDGVLSFKGHALFAAVAAAAAGVIELAAVPGLKKLLDGSDQRSAEARKFLKNAITENISRIPNIEEKSPEEIKNLLFSDEQKALYEKAILRGISAPKRKRQSKKV